MKREPTLEKTLTMRIDSEDRKVLRRGAELLGVSDSEATRRAIRVCYGDVGGADTLAVSGVKLRKRGASALKKQIKGAKE